MCVYVNLASFLLLTWRTAVQVITLVYHFPPCWISIQPHITSSTIATEILIQVKTQPVRAVRIVIVTSVKVDSWGRCKPKAPSRITIPVRSSIIYISLCCWWSCVQNIRCDTKCSNSKCIWTWRAFCPDKDQRGPRALCKVSWRCWMWVRLVIALGEPFLDYSILRIVV